MIDTDALSARYRTRAIDLAERRILITRFTGTEQEKDLSEPANCDGFGRIRHFRRSRFDDWPDNPLPIDPAVRFLQLTSADQLRAQVFQNAVCNWRCWYCFVPFNLLSANMAHSHFLSAGDLLDLYLAEGARPQMIDLSGGQPDLTPEWLPWMMAELRNRGLEGRVYLWSDDNLSNDFLWRYLNRDDLELVRSFRGYGRVCCFKGYDQRSFAFNTLAAPELFDRQFDLMRRVLDLGIDAYSYATFTTPETSEIDGHMSRFVDRLQSIHESLPLRLVPLKIEVFTPVRHRLSGEHTRALANQRIALSAWLEQLDRRFSQEERAANIVDIKLR